MSLLSTLRAAPGMLDALGSPVVVYDRHSLQTTELQQAEVVELVLAADAAEGAVSLSVAHPDGARMAGRLPAGLVLTIGAAELKLAADVMANGSALISLPVAALAAALEEGAEISLTRAVELPYIFRPRSSGRMFAPGAGIITGKVRGTLTGTTKPPVGALLNGEEIFKVEAPLGGSVAWRVEAGAMGG